MIIATKQEAANMQLLPISSLSLISNDESKIDLDAKCQGQG